MMPLPTGMAVAETFGAPLVHSVTDPLAFFAAMNDCVTASKRPHPVCGRNRGILVAWRSFPTRPSDLDLMLLGNTRRSFEQNVNLVRETVIHHPLWLSDFGDDPSADNLFLYVTPPMMFWARRGVIIEPTDALEQMLVASDLGEDLPADVFRPPFPACFIRFGKAFHRATTDSGRNGPDDRPMHGVYVFETVREQQRALTLISLFVDDEPPMFYANSIELIFGDESQSLAKLIRETCEADADESAHFESIAQIVAKVFLYMSLPQAVRIEERDYTAVRDRLNRIGPKKAAKLQRQLPDLYDRIILGPQEIHVHGHGEVSPHLRRGHFTMQPHGPRNSLRKLMFIAPIWVRADRLVGHE
jgi:hypothetical protein